MNGRGIEPGYARNKKNRNKLIIFLVSVGLLGILVCEIALMLSTDKSSPSKPHKTMSVAVGKGAYVITITNLGSPELVGQTVDVYVNGTPGSGYEATCSMPAVGKTARIPLNLFVKGRSRFDPRTQAVDELWVGGSGCDYALYH
jgi:hypothetical protein